MYGNCKYAYIKRSFKMNIRYDNGLLFIDIKISYLGKSKLIKNVVIDTGASHTIISPDIVSSIGISASPLDKFKKAIGLSFKSSFPIKFIISSKLGLSFISTFI